MSGYFVTVNGKEFSLRLGEDGLVSFEGSTLTHEVKRISEREFSVKVGPQQVRVVAVRAERGFDVIAGTLRGNVTVESERERLLRRYARTTAISGAKLEVHAPMPAMVVRLDVRVGEKVRKGTPLIVLEAMKMENEIVAPSEGRVKTIHAKAGKPVEKGELLLVLE